MVYVIFVSFLALCMAVIYVFVRHQYIFSHFTLTGPIAIELSSHII